MTELVQADILSEIDPDKLTLILHGCNCFHMMGAGIAGYLAHKYPAVLEADRKTPKGDLNKLGTYSIAKLTPLLYVFNCYTQYHGGAQAKSIHIRKCLAQLREEMGLVCVRSSPDLIDIRSPQIGCGIGGLNWAEVEPIFEQYLADMPYRIFYK